MPGAALPKHWTGKLWAVKQGIEAAEKSFAPKYLMLTDADIVHAPDTLSWLVAQAEAEQLVLTSLTARWRCENLAERVHIPAFIYYFEMLYPFAWVNRPDHPMAGAAGGCMLVRTDALRAAGGIEVIRDALIDDCALAREMKKQGPIWLGLTDRVQSIRPYTSWGDIRRMVARSAYAQLNYSPLMLAGTVAGLVLTYLVPPFMALFASGLGAGVRRRHLGADGALVPADAKVLSALALVGHSPARYQFPLHAVHLGFRIPIRRRQGRGLEGPRSGEGFAMSTAGELRSGKGHRDENFPVASWLIDARHRGIILAFYEFVRVADDIADHATLSADDKLAQLDRLEAEPARQGRRQSRKPCGCAVRSPSAVCRRATRRTC